MPLGQWHTLVLQTRSLTIVGANTSYWLGVHVVTGVHDKVCEGVTVENDMPCSQSMHLRSTELDPVALGSTLFPAPQFVNGTHAVLPTVLL